MDTESLLKEQIEKRFLANSAIEAIEKKVELITKKLILDKYQKQHLFKNELEFELVDVRVAFSNWGIYNLDVGNIEVELAYFCISKLPKNKMEKLKQGKEFYLKYKHLQWSTYSIPLWEGLRYSLTLQDILKGYVNLEIA